MKTIIKSIIIVTILSFSSCQKDSIVNSVINTYSDIKIEDTRTTKRKNGINVYADFELANKDNITIQTNNFGWTCDKQEYPTFISASFRENNIEAEKILKFSLDNNELILNKKNGLFLQSKDTKGFNILGKSTVVSLFDIDNNVIGLKNIFMNKPFCPTASGHYDDEINFFKIVENEDLILNWDQNSDNSFGIAIALSNGPMSINTKEAYIKIVDDNGMAEIPFSEIKEFRSVTIGVFSEEEMVFNTNKKISIATIHYSAFPLLVE